MVYLLETMRFLHLIADSTYLKQITVTPLVICGNNAVIAMLGFKVKLITLGPHLLHLGFNHSSTFKEK